MHTQHVHAALEEVRLGLRRPMPCCARAVLCCARAVLHAANAQTPKAKDHSACLPMSSAAQQPVG